MTGNPDRPGNDRVTSDCVHCTDAVDLLREIANSDPVDNALDPDRNRRIARDFIASLLAAEEDRDA